MSEPQQTVTIPLSEYTALRKADRTLDALYAGGVDDWEWYGDSMQPLWDEDEAEGKAEAKAESAPDKT